LLLISQEKLDFGSLFSSLKFKSLRMLLEVFTTFSTREEENMLEKNKFPEPLLRT
jgi:hypothetical protein